MTSTCQICGRAIKANTGTIAHHGYTRPGQGWQTASCFGAKYRPYEVACDALPLAIKSVANYIEMRTQALAELTGNPPATLTYTQTDAWGKVVRETTYDRPADFDAARCEAVYTQGYKMQFNKLRNSMVRDIEGSKETKKAFEKRLDNWKPAGE